MIKRIIVVFGVLFVIVLIFYCYNFLIIGKNKNIESIDELDDYILGIKDFIVEAKVTVNSNKNSNTYFLKQELVGGVLTQEINDTDDNIGIVIVNEKNKVTVKNTNLGIEKVYDLFGDVATNAMGLNSFVEDYKCDKKRKYDIKDDCFVVSVKAKNQNNRYSKSKVLYFNKYTSKIEKIVIKDINNKDMIIIEYSNVELL